MLRKYLRAGIVEPQVQTPTRPSKLGPFAEKLSGWRVNKQRKPHRDRHTAKQMHAGLVPLALMGHMIGSRCLCGPGGLIGSAVQTTGRGTFVPLVFKPGEEFNFDWSEDWPTIGGERVKLQVALIKLSHSGALLVRAYLLQTHEMLFDANWRAFRVFGSIPGRDIYDGEAWPRWIRGQAERIRLLIMLDEASSAM